MTATPIVLVEIDADSRLVIRQSAGVRVAFVDRRIDNYGVIVFDETDQMEAILRVCMALPILSPKTNDDASQTALSTLARLARGDVVVSEGPL